MTARIITPEDLEEFRKELLRELKSLLSENNLTTNKGWLRTSELCKYLNVSASTLQNLRNSGILPYTQFSPGGAIYYRVEDIERIFYEKANNGIENTKIE